MKKILVAVDLQNDFVTGALGTPEAAAMLPQAAAKIAGFDGEVIFTMDTHGDDYMETSEGKKLPVSHCIKDTEGWKLAPEIEALAKKLSAVIIEKPTFGSKALAEYIASRYDGHPASIQLIGICTDICVISNAMVLKAFFPEASISVDSRCCAGVTPQSHETALKAMEACQIDII